MRRPVEVSAYRLRVGNYRAMVDIAQAQLRVLSFPVGHRRAICEEVRPRPPCEGP